jgi:hypothetical protein
VEKFRAVLLDVWREACRHIEISQSTETIAAMLVRHMPVDQVIVRRLDRQRSCLETVAVGSAGTQHSLPHARSECSTAEIERLVAWCERGEVAHLPPGSVASGE